MPRSPDFLTAAGIGVSNLKRSTEFYEHALGMKPTQTIKLDYMEEVIMSHEGRNAVVLMHFTDGSNPNYRNLPVKLVFYVTDPNVVVRRVREAGCEVTREPQPVPSFNNAVIALCKDPDGYVVELIEAPQAKPASAAA
jgi:predicted enzyme related to lactoylglutathione lyase